ncbi:MAG: type IX secretion system protein PorQ [Ignavibacteriaceae bacterium]|nr:type IX secretion system protein PorQ [Ignavibacteriaceae bacterium]
MISILRISALLIILSVTIYSQNTYEFLRIDPSPRSAALGGSFTSGSDGSDVLFHNPAGMYSLQNTPVSFNFMKYLLDINFVSLSGSKEIPGVGRMGAAVKYVNYGTFTGADEFGNKLEDYGAGELAAIIGYSNRIDENFYYGAGVKFIYSSLAGYSSTGVGLDLGVQYNIPSELITIGVSLTNLGTQISSYVNTKEELPLDLSVGFSKRLAHIPLKIYLDFHKLNQKAEAISDRLNSFSVGGEFRLSEAFTLRLGYDNEKRKELKIGDFAGLAGFNLGLGLKIKTYNFDYAYSSWGEIGSLHRIGLNTEL